MNAIDKMCPISRKKCMGRKCAACVVYKSCGISGRRYYSTSGTYLKCSYLRTILKVLKKSVCKEY